MHGVYERQEDLLRFLWNRGRVKAQDIEDASSFTRARVGLIIKPYSIFLEVSEAFVGSDRHPQVANKGYDVPLPVVGAIHLEIIIK